MRLMARHGLVPVSRSARRYSSYRGEIGEAPVIHSDRGCHYRWPEWIRICKGHGLTRSMSAKGCSPDNATAKGCSPGNAAAEGFFGRLKQEFFHKRSFAGVSMDGFIDMLDDYMVRYRDRRIKTESGHGHHGPSTRARSCGMTGGGGINDESNKTAPAPAAHVYLTINTPMIRSSCNAVNRRSIAPFLDQRLNRWRR